MSASEPPDLRLIPAAVGAWASAWAATSGESAWGVSAIAAGVLLAVGAVALRRWWVGAAALVVLACLLAGSLRVWGLQQSALGRLAADGAVARVQIRVTGDPVVLAGSGTRPALVTVAGSGVRVEGRGLAWLEQAPVRILAASIADWRGIPVGAVVDVAGKLEPPPPGDGIAASVRVRSEPRLLDPPDAAMAFVERIRSGLRSAMAAEGGEPGALVPALVLGDTSAVPAELTLDMRETGLTHLSAVSGANLTLLLAFVLTSARWAGVRGWWLRGLAVGSVAGFVLLCRAEPSVVRAAAMGLVALVGLSGGHRDAGGPRNLAIAVVGLMLLDPWLSRSLGFQLSVAATGGILALAGRWAVALSWLPRFLAEAVSLPLAAQVATQPLVTALSGRVSMVGILANAVVGPAVGPATVLGLATALLSLLADWAAALPAWVAGMCTQLIVWVAHAGADLPGAALNWPVTPAGLALLTALSLTACAVGSRLLRRRWLVVGVTLALLLALTRPPLQPGWPPSQWDLVACDVGQGDALVARVALAQGLLVDTGPDPEALLDCLAGLGIQSLPLVVLTHFHADHAGGIERLLTSVPVGQILLPDDSAGSGRAALMTLAARAGARVLESAVGQTLRVGEASWLTLASGRPPGLVQAGEGESAAENDAGLVGRLEVSGLTILIAGDLEVNGQRALLASGRPVDCDVLKVPHHGSARQDEAFLRATGAKVALLSVGAHNEYGHPAARTTKALRALGMLILRTDEQGSVALGLRDGRLELVTQR